MYCPHEWDGRLQFLTVSCRSDMLHEDRGDRAIAVSYSASYDRTPIHGPGQEPCMIAEVRYE